MHKKIVVFTSIIFVCLSCSITKKDITGYYESNCILNAQSNLILEMKSNGVFKYNKAFLDDTIVGTWKFNGDTLILVSDFFTDDYKKKRFPDVPIDLTPNFKFTDNKNVDVYLLKGKNLYPINKTKNLGECILKKTK